jgi:pimeloyl-ACP methyl ester carboxylesterase
MKRLIDSVLMFSIVFCNVAFASDQTNCVNDRDERPTDIPALVGEWQKAAYGLTELKAPEGCPEPWHCGSIPFETQVSSAFSFGRSHSVSAQIRAGYLPESPAVPFKGNIVYYEGLGDSMLNHLPLFEKLTQAGYRVVAFDYMGQGGSTGNMDNTSLAVQKYGRDLGSFPKPTIIGWSTGGVAAYYAAHTNQADQVVLIAPGIAPKTLAGKQQLFPPKLDEITLDTLTTQTYTAGQPNPHVDPIRPQSPLAVPDLIADQEGKASDAQKHWGVSSDVRGFVLLSGKSDSYINDDETRKALEKQVPQFSIRQYTGSLHEIDNEVPAISDQADADILSFLSKGR